VKNHGFAIGGGAGYRLTIGYAY